MLAVTLSGIVWFAKKTTGLKKHLQSPGGGRRVGEHISSHAAKAAPSWVDEWSRSRRWGKNWSYNSPRHGRHPRVLPCHQKKPTSVQLETPGRRPTRIGRGS